MIRALVRKELRQLLPVTIGLYALMAWEIVDVFLLKPADTHSWGQLSWVLSVDLRSWTAVGELIVALVIAYCLLPGEHAQKTIDFLYTLPIRRRTLFLTKYLVGVGLHVALSLTGTSVLLLRHALNPDSFERRMLAPSHVVYHLAGDLALPLIFVAYGMLLSYFRRLGWILAALYWLALEVAEHISPALRIFNVKALTTVEHDGLTPIIDGRAWALHAALGAVALVLAARLWLGQGEQFVAFYDRLRASRGLRLTGAVLAVACLALFLSSLIGVGTSGLLAPASDATPASRVQSFDTEHFHFTYRDRHSDRARVVIDAADQAYVDVKRWLGAPAVDRITADLTGEGVDHLGIAGWTTMRMDLSRPSSAELLRHVLLHETTHVLAAALTDGIANARNNDTRFFAEGLAEYVAYDLRPDLHAERERARQVAALAHRQFRLRFEDLLAPKIFLQRHDEFLLYPLGEVFAAALVAICGRESPPEVLRTLARPDTPQTLEGFELWRYALQKQRCDLDRVIGQYEKRLRELEADAVKAVPVATAHLTGREGGLLIFEVTVRSAAPGPWTVSVRVRPDAEAPPSAMRIAEEPVAAGQVTHLRVTAPATNKQRIEFQAGARFGVRSAFFTRWQSTALP